MNVCIDCGNTRIKWGVAPPDASADWLAQGSLGHEEIGLLPACLQGPLQQTLPGQVLISNVAGATIAEGLHTVLAGWPLHFVRAETTRCGVQNGYQHPERLGVDRWCALIAAYPLLQARTTSALVVSAGTATTIDHLDASGRFQGGMILPGVEMMRRSLSQHTAQLPLAQGALVDWPQGTDDAIISGCLNAQLGAIERSFARLQAQNPACPPLCLLTGGAAPLLQPHLAIPCQPVAHLVLEGLRRIALTLPAPLSESFHTSRD